MTEKTYPPLPTPHDYYYEWDGTFGKRKFTSAPHNGRNCDRVVGIYTEAQMRAYYDLGRDMQAQAVPQPKSVKLAFRGESQDTPLTPVTEFLADEGKATVHSAPATLSDALRETLISLIADRLSGTYHCNRVWEAWSYGTMGAGDFEDVGESDTPAELADAILGAIAAQTAPQSAVPQGAVVWPTMPPSMGQSPVLFEDGYAEGWAKCLAACQAALTAAQQAAPVEQGDSLDAARYRWLRDRSRIFRQDPDMSGNHYWMMQQVLLRGPTLDAAIDAARSQTKGD